MLEASLRSSIEEKLISATDTAFIHVGTATALPRPLGHTNSLAFLPFALFRTLCMHPASYPSFFKDVFGVKRGLLESSVQKGEGEMQVSFNKRLGRANEYSIDAAGLETNNLSHYLIRW